MRTLPTLPTAGLADRLHACGACAPWRTESKVATVFALQDTITMRDVLAAGLPPGESVWAAFNVSLLPDDLKRTVCRRMTENLPDPDGSIAEEFELGHYTQLAVRACAHAAAMGRRAPTEEQRLLFGAECERQVQIIHDEMLQWEQGST